MLDSAINDRTLKDHHARTDARPIDRKPLTVTAPDALWQGFCSPPDEARPRAWWHWMDGNVDHEGIQLDLAWLHRVGVRGVQMFDGGMGTPLVVPAKVQHGSQQWGDAVKLAAGRARELELGFTVATSPVHGKPALARRTTNRCL